MPILTPTGKAVADIGPGTLTCVTPGGVHTRGLIITRYDFHHHLGHLGRGGHVVSHHVGRRCFHHGCHHVGRHVFHHHGTNGRHHNHAAVHKKSTFINIYMEEK